ncbi:ABC transporter permease [Bifidobacterium polysaccharolyticum]|uniref:ABC transporter permease n=1 Tax=Bifidobacterium asteroides TaxID=1684 RepID=A0ABS3IT67_9BIFI|nr:ABC transporter permease [Bifidobacterium polysaccharolyticum]MBI0063458.1 ABC transporter permease [Bifidobacterium polysaccharolyticum]
MKTLLQLELKKTRLWPCIFGGLAVVAASLALGGMFLAIGHTSGRSDPRLSSLAFVLQMAMVILLVGFSLVAAALCNLVFIEPYTGRNLTLTLSCPISRERILLAKLVFVGFFTALSYLAGTAVTLTVLLLVDRLVGSLGKGSPVSLFGQVLFMLVTSLAGLAGLVGIALSLGFWKRSLPIMFGVLLLLDALVGNLLSLSPLLSALVLLIIFLTSLPAWWLLHRTLMKIELP